MVLVSNELVVVGASKAQKQWARATLEFDNPVYIKNLRMGVNTREIPKKISLYKRDGENILLPYGVLDVFAAEFPDECFLECFLECFPDGELIEYPADFGLYTYQEEAVKTMLEYKSGILVSPPGSGKTQMALAMICQIGGRALWITHTADLLNQSYGRAKQYMPEKLLGKITEGKVDMGTGITFATVQTLSSIDPSIYSGKFRTVIVDECHRVSGSPTTCTMFYKVLSNISAPYKYGVTATPHRADGFTEAMYALLGPINFTVSKECVKDRIMPVTVRPIQTGYKRHNDTRWDGQMEYQTMISNMVDDGDRNHLIARLIRQETGHSILVLTDRVSHSQTLLTMLPTDLQEKACIISGTTKKDLRETYLSQMRTGEKTILFATYKLAKEGLDIPRLDRLIMATPQTDYAVVAQSIGRIARQSEGKTDAICLDLVDNDPYLMKAFKKRCTTYRKEGAIIEK